MNITKADRQRFMRLRDLGCIVAKNYLDKWMECEIHHVLSGGRRIGHQATIPLNPWFHRGVPPAHMTQTQAREKLGPSKALDPSEFRKHFGTDAELLALTDGLLNARPEA